MKTLAILTLVAAILGAQPAAGQPVGFNPCNPEFQKC